MFVIGILVILTIAIKYFILKVISRIREMGRMTQHP